MTSTFDTDERSSHDDVDLTFSDIQSLSSADEVTRFFTTLQYNTDARIEQSLEAMGILSEKLRHDIRNVERIAHNEDDFGAFEVYLFEVRSLTNTFRKELVQQFRNRSGDFLLVLTETANPYERLDFVLVERYNQTITSGEETLLVQPLPGTRSPMVRARVLSVERLKPDEVELRVLRRFTWTEGDTIAQYEKVLHAYALASWSEPYFNNRALFSDYYLLHRLPERTLWKGSQALSEMTRAYRQLRPLYEDAREECSGKSLATVEQNLFTPVLQHLGFTPGIERSGVGDSTRDVYYLFASDVASTNGAKAARRAKGVQGEKPLALCIPCVWGRNLDGTDELRDSQTPEENPGAFVVSLLDAGEVDWAIVTNGISWRLYSAKAHSRATNYYEIFLPDTLAMPQQQGKEEREKAFAYFWHLFRAAAFQATSQSVEGEARSLSLLDDLLLESDLHARELGEKLKTRIFEEIFPNFAEGFVHHARQHGMLPDDLETHAAGERNTLLEPYFTATLTFLYRLLFLFYAESRDLLPVRQEHGYAQKSLQHLKQRIRDDAGELEDKVAENLHRYSATETTLYDELQTLFAAVDKGNPDLNVPVYNGGLFLTSVPPSSEGEPQEITVARFLQAHKIPDRQLALGLDRMARDVDEKQARATRAEDVNGRNHWLIFIDYKSLGVRHLGSIYEGLLEFKVRIASEEMAVVKGKRTDEIIPYSEAKQSNRKPLKDKQGRERLYARGSVYLENDRCERKATGSYYTPDYIVKYIVEQTVKPVLAEKLEGLKNVFREAQRTLDAEQRKAQQLKSGVSPEHETYKQYRVSLNEAFFDLKVLDPAMGSGHFLVEAVDYITDQMAKVLTRYKWSPILYELKTTRQKIQASMEQQGVSIDSDKLTDLNLLKRRVLKSCIYGVDLNPMAVELAKVSLWLDCFTLGAPLSFLDHHLKCGNSLIGADVQKVRAEITGSLVGWQFDNMLEAAQIMRKVGKLSDSTAEEVAESRTAYYQAADQLAPYKRVLNVWLSEYFGYKNARKTASDYVDKIIDDTYASINKADKEAIEAAQPLAASKRFFHWQLEFPEVFYDERESKEDGGFDAVIGNPPYIPNEQIQSDEKGYYAKHYPISLGKYDLSVIFLVRNSELLPLSRKFGMIVPVTWQTGDNYLLFREKYFQTFSPSIIINLPFDVFPDAYVDTCIAIFSKPSQEAFSVYAYDKKYFIEESIRGNQQFSRVLMAQVRRDLRHRVFMNSKHYDFLAKFSEPMSSSLGKITIACQGPVESFFEYSSYHQGKGWLEYRTCDVYRYELEDTEKKFVNFGTANPLIKFYIVPRILIRRIVSRSNRLMAAFAQDPFVVKKDLNPFVLTVPEYDLRFLLANINSTLHSYFYIEASTVAGKDDFRQTTLTALQALPIRRINFVTSDKDRTYYLDKAKLLYQQCMSKNDEDYVCVTGFVEHHLSKEPEESDVVHDLLVFLAEQMLDLNKRKRTMQKEFLDWLVQTLRVIPDKNGEKSGIEVLTNRGKLQEFAGDYQKGEPELTGDELWEIVTKNRARLGVRLSLDGLEKRVLGRYQESLNEVLPLKEQLRRTDELIDKIVYRLYGLTEEEIAIVEGHNS